MKCDLCKVKLTDKNTGFISNRFGKKYFQCKMCRKKFRKLNNIPKNVKYTGNYKNTCDVRWRYT